MSVDRPEGSGYDRPCGEAEKIKMLTIHTSCILRTCLTEFSFHFRILFTMTIAIINNKLVHPNCYKVQTTRSNNEFKQTSKFKQWVTLNRSALRWRIPALASVVSSTLYRVRWQACSVFIRTMAVSGVFRWVACEWRYVEIKIMSYE